MHGKFPQNPSSKEESNINNNKRQPDELPIKQFVVRNSLLTDLYENRHVQAALHIFVMILVGQFVHSAATDILYKGRLDLGLDLIQRSFSNFHWIAIIWASLFSSTVSVYFGLVLWAFPRTALKQQGFWDVSWILVVSVYYISFLCWPVVALSVCEIRPAAKFGFSCEILRLLMKAHAFIRSSVPMVLKQNPRNRPNLPEFGKFMYFLWAPTLLYRDSYPRTSSIRWRTVFNHLLQFAAVIFFASFIFEKYIINVFKDYGRKPFIWQEVVVIICGNTPAAIGMILALFYIIQHAWMNACAEMLTFGDRLFYQDWWTATSFKDYFRKWNVLVQDWLYTYIYKDFYETITPQNKTAANYVIFLISALAHEYITGLSFGFVLPILFVAFFGAGVHMAHIELKPRLAGNVFVFYLIALGMSMLSSFYAIEYFYRANCPEENVTFISYLIPRFMTCKMEA